MADNYDNIPDELKKLPRWVVSTAEEDADTKETISAKKCPINARTGKRALSNDPRTWSTFDEATQAIATQIPTRYGKGGGCGVAGHLGFMLGEGYAGIDLDHVVTDGVIVPWAAQVVAEVGSYAEYSPSGTGLHIIVRDCKVPEGVGHKKAVATNEDGSSQEMEVYDSGRYFRMSGAVIPHSANTICDNQAAFTAVCERHLSKGRQSKAQPVTRPIRPADQPATVATVLEKMFNSEHGAKWESVYEGDMSGYDNDHSDADYALCHSLAFWSDGDASLIDACFRGSGLMRDKWDELHGAETYGDATIEKAVRDYQAEHPDTTHSRHHESLAPTEDAEGFVVPPPYVFHGGSLYMTQGEDKPERLVMRSRLEVVGKLQMHDSTVRYTVRAGGSGGRTLDVDAKAVKCKRDAVERFGGAGYDVNDANSNDVIKWFSAQIAANEKSITTTKGMSHAGWLGGGRGFAPYFMGSYEFAPTAGYEDVGKALMEPRGTLDGWCDVVRAQREGNDVFRFMIAASFAAPLVGLIGFQSRFIYIEGKSRHGKSAALKACASVWGNPDVLVNQYRDTLNALLSNASFLCNLPFLVDELQSAPAKDPAGKRKYAESLAYAFGEGHDKTRLDRGAKKKAAGSWQTLAIANGEQSVISGSTGTGAGNRTAELVGVPFDGEQLTAASEMHIATKTQYGTAGRAFIEYLLAKYGDDVEKAVRQGYEKTLAMVRAEYPTHPHADLVALVTFADALASAAVFKVEGPEVLERSLDMARHVLPRTKGAEELDVGRRSAQFVVDWLSTNAENFDVNVRVRFGWKEIAYGGGEGKDNIWSVIPTNMNKALDENGYDHEQAMKNLAEVGALVREDSSHLTRSLSKDGKRLRCYQIDGDKLAEYLG